MVGGLSCSVLGRFRLTLLSIAVTWILVVSLSVAASAASGGHDDILGIRGMDISSVEIVRGDLRTVLEKVDEAWRVVHPVDEPADQEAVAALLDRLANLTVADVLDAGAPVNFGFDPPQARVRLSDGNGVVRELQIGNLRSPVSLFVRPLQSPVVYAVSNVSLARIGSYPMSFVDRILFQAEPASVRRVTVEYAAAPEEAEEGAEESRRFVIVRHPSGSWLSEEGTLAFDVDRFLESIRLLQSADRAEGGAARFYPEPGTARFTVELADGSSEVIHLGSVSPDGNYRYVRVGDRPGVYKMSRFYGEHILAQALGINDSLLSIDRENINQLTVTLGDGTTATFQRSSGTWQVNRQVVFGVDPLLDAVTSVGATGPAEELSDAAGYGFGTAPGSVTVNIRFVNNTTLELRLGGPHPDGGVYVAASNRPGVYVGLPESAVEIGEALAAVRQQFFPVAAANVAKVEIRTVSASGDESVRVLERSGSGWVKDGDPVDAARVEAIFPQLTGLAVDRIPPLPEEESELGFYPLPGSVQVAVTFNDGSERVIDIGAAFVEGAGTWFAQTFYYARVSDLEEVVLLREASVNGLNRAISGI